ncbi:MAG: cell division protein ZapA [Bacteroidaceae bacterium]|nr:cell division protein ZapA [Bacteroidaceae bacterium]
MAKGLTVNVNIEGATLPMTVASVEDEERVRKAATMVNSRLQAVRNRFPSVPNEKYYYYMVLLNTTVDALKAEQRTDIRPIMELLEGLSSEINDAIGI